MNGPGGAITPLEQRALEAIDPNGIARLLGELVAFPSVANEESPAQHHVSAAMTSFGMATDVWEIDFQRLTKHPSYTADVERSRGVGVVGELKGSGGGRTLILNGHIDVVPAGDPARWKRPPFQLTQMEGRFYGRGVVDMKGALCCALIAAKTLHETRIPLRGSLQIQSVLGEEDGGAGTLATIERGHTADGAVVLEPTEFVLAPAQAGALSFRLTVPGLAAHGAFREEGVDPVEKFIPLFHALRLLEADRNRGISDPLFRDDALPFALTMGRLSAGIWPSTVAENLTVEGRYGVTPEEDESEARKALEHAVNHAARKDPWLRDHPPVVEWRGAQFAAARTDPQDAVVTTLSDAAADVLGATPLLRGVRFGSDMRLLTNVGRIPTVLFGPGDVREAHRPNESVAEEDLLRATQILVLAAMRFCGTEEL